VKKDSEKCPKYFEASGLSPYRPTPNTAYTDVATIMTRKVFNTGFTLATRPLRAFSKVS
jgi:hypothetical protein